MVRVYFVNQLSISYNPFTESRDPSHMMTPDLLSTPTKQTELQALDLDGAGPSNSTPLKLALHRSIIGVVNGAMPQNALKLPCGAVDFECGLFLRPHCDLMNRSIQFLDVWDLSGHWRGRTCSQSFQGVNDGSVYMRLPISI